jgi:integrase
LRHTAVSLLKDAGIPQAAVQELIGHDSEQMSALYTHVGREALEKAAAAGWLEVCQAGQNRRL